jgi:RNA polymerase sigma-70 factor (ECF subfamily)
MVRDPDKSMTPDQFMRLFLRSERDIFRYVAVLVPSLTDAQDIVQETAVALWKKIDQYDPQQPFTPWACRFALFEARQHMRRQQRLPDVFDVELVDQLISRRTEIAHTLDERREHLADCIGRLPGEQRKIIERYYYDQMPVESIATNLGRTTDAVYKALQRIRQSLCNCVEQKMRGEGA